MANRGRPKKEDTIYNGNTYGFINVNGEAARFDSVAKRAPKQNQDYKFEDTNKLQNSLQKILAWGIHNCPFGLIMKNCNDHEVRFIDELLAEARYDSNKLISLASYLSDYFESTATTYNRTFVFNASNKLKNIAYKFTVHFDMRRYANNLSLIYHIINDIHYNLFRDHLACYLFNYSNNEIDPAATLTVYVSNAAVYGKSRLSSIFANNFDYIQSSITYIIGNDLRFFTNKETNTIMIKPLFITENSNTIPESIKPKGMTYASWYKSLYGDSIMKDKAEKEIITKIN